MLRNSLKNLTPLLKSLKIKKMMKRKKKRNFKENLITMS
jgi:hypothetical protein